MIQFSNSLMIKIVVTVLLAVIFLLPFFSAQKFSPSGDEITHLPSGYSYWKTGEIKLNPQHPPLVKLMAAFPLLFMDLKFDKQDPNLFGPLKNEWVFGNNFLTSNDIDKLLFWGRLPVMFFSVLLGFYIYLWASELFGSKGGLLSLFLYALMPNIIAHAQFVTTDLALASFSFITFYYLWKFFSAPKGRDLASGGKINLNKHLIYSGLFLGLALSSKFSAVVFLPVILFLIFINIKSKQGDFHQIVRRSVGIAAIMIIPAFLVVYFSYLLPADTGFYLKGLKSVYADQNSSFRFYLNGQFSKSGWWYYFLEGFLIKTPIPALVAFAAALAFWKKLNINNRDRLFIFMPMLFFSAVTSLKAHNIGIRYLLPAFPFLILYAGGLAQVIKISRDGVKSAAVSSVAIILGLWYIFSSLSIFPDYLAYFNEFVGGSDNGYKYMDDSNLEWKHDLKRLAEYQKTHPDVSVIYSDKGSDIDPRYYGIKNVVPQSEELISNPSGKYAININLLVRLKGVSRTLKNEKLDWLSLYKPIGKINYSFFVYEFK